MLNKAKSTPHFDSHISVYTKQLYRVLESWYQRKHSKILDELYILNILGLTVVAERVFDGDEVDVTDPVFDIPWQCPSENQNYINYILPMALSSELVPINPRVSMEEFSKVLTLLKAKGEFLHGAQDHLYTSAFRQ